MPDRFVLAFAIPSWWIWCLVGASCCFLLSIYFYLTFLIYGLPLLWMSFLSVQLTIQHYTLEASKSTCASELWVSVCPKLYPPHSFSASANIGDILDLCFISPYSVCYQIILALSSCCIRNTPREFLLWRVGLESYCSGSGCCVGTGLISNQAQWVRGSGIATATAKIVATAQIQSLPQELLYAVVGPLKK